MPAMPEKSMSRRRFLELGAVAIPAAALALLSACGGEEDEDDEGEDDD